MHPNYSIIIPAYNEAAELPATLAAIRSTMAQQELHGECIVVDNNSTDATSAIAKREGADQVVFEPINQISRARNTGAKASRGRYLIFIDADTRINRELMSEALSLMQSNHYVGGGALVEFEEKAGLIGQACINLWKFISRWTRTAAGSFFFSRRDAFEEIGGFDLKLYASEEIRLSRKLCKWGRRRNQRFEIITRTPARTSARKLEWHSSAKMLFWIFLIPLMPLVVRSRVLCSFWYKRPDFPKCP